MTPLRLTSWFRKRMLALVVTAAVPIAAAAPLALYVQEHYDLLERAHDDGERIAAVIRAELYERPRIWRYDATKLGERIAAEGLDPRPLRLFAGGREVAIERVHPPPAPAIPLWSHQTVAPGVELWVAADEAPLRERTWELLGLFSLLAAALGLGLYLVPVRAVAGAERRTHRLLGQLALTLADEDRRRIARDLHDGAGQALTAARLELLALSARAPAEAREALGRIAARLDEAVAEVRRSSAALGPPALEELGFARALERHCEAFADSAGLEVRCQVAPLPPLAAELELAGYRIVQEALTNVARHARATRASVSVQAAGGSLCIEVSDDGRGLPAGEQPGRGLGGIRERAELLGGALRLGSPPGGGATVAVEMPLALGEGA